MAFCSIAPCVVVWSIGDSPCQVTCVYPLNGYFQRCLWTATVAESSKSSVLFSSVRLLLNWKKRGAEVDHNFVSRQENISRCGLYFNYSTDFEEDSDDYSIESLTTGFVALFGSEEWRKEVIQIDWLYRKQIFGVCWKRKEKIRRKYWFGKDHRSSKRNAIESEITSWTTTVRIQIDRTGKCCFIQLCCICIMKLWWIYFSFVSNLKCWIEEENIITID